MTSEHFRLQTSYPAEVSRATQPFTDLLVEEIREAVATGRLHPHDPEYSAWLITQLAMAVFHHYDCAGLDEPIEQIADKVWAFCFTALGGPVPPPSSAKAAARRPSKPAVPPAPAAEAARLLPATRPSRGLRSRPCQNQVLLSG